jgi:hypothetical protein
MLWLGAGLLELMDLDETELGQAGGDVIAPSLPGVVFVQHDDDLALAIGVLTDQFLLRGGKAAAHGLAQNPVGHAVFSAPLAAVLAPIRLVGNDHLFVALDDVLKFPAVMHVGRRHGPVMVSAVPPARSMDIGVVLDLMIHDLDAAGGSFKDCPNSTK